MRRLLPILLLLLPASAVARSGEPYVNARFGFAVDIPPGFTLVHEAENGDGRTYAKDTAVLAIWGHHLVEESFKEEVADRRKAYIREGWVISYDRETSGWASLSGTRDTTIFYHRTIRLCDDSLSSFVLEFPKELKPEYSPLVGALVKSLRPAGGCTRAQGAAPGAQ